MNRPASSTPPTVRFIENGNLAYETSRTTRRIRGKAHSGRRPIPRGAAQASFSDLTRRGRGMMPGLGIGIVVLAVLLAASIATFRVAKLLGIPVMISLVIAGLVAEMILPPRIHIELGPQVLALCLPALIFEAAWDCDAAVLRGVALQVTLLAVPGVFATTAIFALAATLSGIVAWPAALVLGAIVAATDPVAVLAIFRRLELPERLTAIVEGESVANDGVAIVLVSALVGFAVSGTLADGVLGTIAFMVYEAAAGIAIGAGVALCAGYVMRARIGVSGWVAVSLVVAYGAYAIAGAAHASGIFATAAAGMMLRARVAADRYGPGARAVDRARTSSCSSPTSRCSCSWGSRCGSKSCSANRGCSSPVRSPRSSRARSSPTCSCRCAG